MIPFNKPIEIDFFRLKTEYNKANKESKISNDTAFIEKCNLWIEQNAGTKKALLTPSGTHALELAAILCDIKCGDEVIMPSYTFPSTANAFALRGAKIVFVDIRPDTMNINEDLIEQAITDKTKAIVPVHYAGVSCEMDTIMRIANQYHLYIIEDAAQCVGSSYKNQALGSIGHLGCYSFHATKNYSMGEGGALLINNPNLIERAEIIREKGTNRSSFLKQEIETYTWVDIGSSYIPSDLAAAHLFTQLQDFEQINNDRLHSWQYYFDKLLPLVEQEKFDIMFIPEECQHNAHAFYIKTKNSDVRSKLKNYLKKSAIETASHYIPLHSSPAGDRFGRFNGEDVYTTSESERLLRLPMYYKLNKEEIDTVIDAINQFYKS